MKIPKQQYTTEFKELAVTRVREGQSAGAVAKELGLIEKTLRNWVKAAAAGTLNGAGPRWSRRSRWNSPGSARRTSGSSGRMKS
jgi:transposase-like protein